MRKAPIESRHLQHCITGDLLTALLICAGHYIYIEANEGAFGDKAIIETVELPGPPNVVWDASSPYHNTCQVTRPSDTIKSRGWGDWVGWVEWSAGRSATDRLASAIRDFGDLEAILCLTEKWRREVQASAETATTTTASATDGRCLLHCVYRIRSGLR